MYRSSGLESNSTSNESNNGPTTDLHSSEEERRKYLQELQAQTTLAMIPAMIFIILMAVIGVFGNSLVLYVYSRKFTLNGTRVFIVVIAAFDLITNIIGIPEEIYRMFHFWDFNRPWRCKLFVFTNVLTIMVSAKMLVALAVVRYRKVCVTSGWQISAHQAKIIAAILIFTSFLFSAPSVIVNGVLTRETPHPEINGYECVVDDIYVNTIWQLAYSAALIFLFLVCCSIMMVLYILLGAKVLRHSRAIRKVTYSPVTDGSSSSDGAVTSSTSNSKLAISGTAEDKHFKEGWTTSGGDLKSYMKVSTSPKSDTPSKKRELHNMATLHEKDEYAWEDEKSQRSNRDNVTDASNQEEGVGIEADPISPEAELSLCSFRGAVQSEERQINTGIILQTEDLSAKINNPETIDSDKHCRDSKPDLSEEVKVNEYTKKPQANFVNKMEEPTIEFSRDMESVSINYYKKEKRPMESDADTQKVTPIEVMLLESNSLSYINEVSQDDSFLCRNQNFKKNKNMKMKSCCSTTPWNLTKDDANNHSRKDANATGKHSLKRTTVMLIAISVVFIIGFIPYLILVSYFYAKPKSYIALGGADLTFYHLFVRFPFLNCAANVVIYGICDLAFRRKCMSVIRQKLLCFRS